MTKIYSSQFNSKNILYFPIDQKRAFTGVVRMFGFSSHQLEMPRNEIENFAIDTPFDETRAMWFTHGNMGLLGICV